MATQPPPGPAWPQVVQQVLTVIAASNAAVDCSFENLEVVLPQDGTTGAPPTRVLLNGTVRLRVTAER